MFAGVSDTHGQVRSRSDKIQVTGRVVDSAGVAIERATIRLFAGVDTVRAVTGAEGKFSAYIARHPDSLLRIRIAHLAYDPLSKSLRPQPTDTHAFDFDRLILKDRSIALDEVAVAGRPEVYISGDTTFFETRHIQVAEHAFTEELMRRLPGMRVDESGRLSYLGKRIEYVRLNGIDFFGGDVLLALKNLPADLILRLQLIEEHGPEYLVTGIRSDSPTQVLNLVVEEDNTRGKFSSGTVGYGTDDTNVLNGAGHLFNKERQVAISGGTNNIADPLHYVAGYGSVSRVVGGITTTSGLSVQAQDKFGENTSGSMMYSLNEQQDEVRSDRRSWQSYGDDTEIYSRQHRRDRRRSVQHDMNQFGVSPLFRWNSNDKRSGLTINPSFVHNRTTSSGEASSMQEYYHQGRLGSAQHSRTMSAGSGLERHGGITLQGTLGLKNRHTLVTRASIRSRYNNDVNEIRSEIFRIGEDADAGLDSLSRQDIRQDNLSTSWLFRATYAGLKLDDQNLSFSLNVDQTITVGSRNVYDLLAADVLIDSLSSKNRMNQLQAVLGSSLGGTFGKNLRYSLGANLTLSRQRHEDGRYPDRPIDRNALHVTPDLQLTKAGPRNQANLRYSYRLQQPSFRMLNPIPDYQLPELVVFGNPNLKAALFHQMSLMSTIIPTSPGKGSRQYTLSVSYITDKIVQDLRIITLPKGLIRHETHFRNLSGDVKLEGEAIMPIKSMHFANGSQLGVNTNSNLSFGRERYYEAGEVGSSFLSSVRLSLQNYYHTVRDNYSLDIAYGFQYNSVENTVGVSSIHTFSARLSGSQTVWRNIKLSGNLSKAFNWGYRGPANAHPFIANLRLEGNVYKNKLTWRLSANDLLNQGSDQGRTVSRNEITDYYNNVLGRYVMASLNWRVGQFGPK